MLLAGRPGVEAICAFVGGMRLAGPVFEPIIPRTVVAVRELAPEFLVPGHCTSWRGRSRSPHRPCRTRTDPGGVRPRDAGLQAGDAAGRRVDDQDAGLTLGGGIGWLNGRHVGLQHIHGAASRVDRSATAFPHRAEQYDFLILSQWPDAADSSSTDHQAGRGVCYGFRGTEQRQSVMWGNSPYQNITETIPDIHSLMIERLDPQPGIRWLDLACGTGAVAELAARAGASVTGVDLVPTLIETARQRAQEQGLVALVTMTQ